MSNAVKDVRTCIDSPCFLCLVPMQSAAGREARAESSSLKEDLSGLQNDLAKATQQLEEERQKGTFISLI